MHKKTTINLPLSISHPDIAKRWHPTKNGNLTLDNVTAGSGKKVWWKCPVEDDHEWEAKIAQMTIAFKQQSKTNGCPMCRGLKVVSSNCLATTDPELAKQFHPTKNGVLTPYNIHAGSHKRVWWQCDLEREHEWEATVKQRKNGNGCPICRGSIVVSSNCLATTDPELAKQFHPTKNGVLTPCNIHAGSHKRVWWQCGLEREHEWKATVYNRANGSGCPFCNSGFTIEHMRLIVKSIISHINNLNPDELFVIFQQSGVHESRGQAKVLAHGIQSNAFSIQDLQAFADNEPSTVDDFLQNNQRKDDFYSDDIENASAIEKTDDNSFFDRIQTIQSKHALEALDKITSMVSDEEAIKFLITSATQKIWQHASVSEIEALEQINAFDGGAYPQEVKRKFLQEYHGTKSIQIPKDYSFKINGEIVRPSLMQLLTSYKVFTEKRFGNWSGTGSGKTLAAIVASRVITATVTVIICPNNVVPGWLKDIPQAFPESDIFTKADINWSNRPSLRPKYLLLNYDFFQQENCRIKLENFLQANQVDFCVLDEIHFSKQREKTKASLRKLNISWFLQQTQIRNPNLHVLGMTATPVINNLYEGRMLLEMITGKSFENIGSKSTLNNCMLLHQKLLSIGIRIRPKYSASLSIRSIEIDGNHLVPEIKQLGKKQELQLEALLTKSKLQTLVQELRNKTIIYTQYIGAGILEMIKTAVNKAGYTFSVFTGEEKDSLDKFIDGDVAVLIASKPISTGIDGLQNVCSRIIINSLPWTSAEFEQLIGRVHRQGQIKNRVEIIVLITTISLNGKVWSWCQMRYNRIKFKRTIADAAVDGIIPDEHIQTTKQAHTYAMEWFKKLERKHQ